MPLLPGSGRNARNAKSQKCGGIPNNSNQIPNQSASHNYIKTMENVNLRNELIQSRTSNAFRWFTDRSENCPGTIHKNLDSVKNCLKSYLNSNGYHFRKNLSKSEKLQAMEIIKNLVISLYNS